jgi:hypothetical protein
MPEPVFTKFGTYITAPEPISTASLKNPSHQSVCLYVYPCIVARQRLGKNPPVVAMQRLRRNPPIVASQWLGRNVTAVTNTRTIIEEFLDASFSMWPVSYQGKQAISSSQKFLFCLIFSRSFLVYFLCRLSFHSSVVVFSLAATTDLHQLSPTEQPI